MSIIKPTPRLAKAILEAPVKIDLSGVAPPDARIVKALAARINVTSTTGLLSDLTGVRECTIDGALYRMRTRNAMSPGYLKAVRYLEQFYAGLRNPIPTVRRFYTANKVQRPQLQVDFLADKPTKRTLFLTSHVDSTVGRPKVEELDAPGADDDGTGTVAQMLIFATLADLRAAGVPININVRGVHFGSEEQQLLGSKQYVAELKNETGIEVIGQLQLEMMGYDGDKSRRVDLHDDEDQNGSHALVESLMRSATAHGFDLGIRDLHVFNPYRPSDHRPFLTAGYRAVCISEDSSDHGVNPNMHTAHDTIDKLDMAYFVDVARFCGAGAIDLALAG